MESQDWNLPPSGIFDSEVVDREESMVEHHGSQLSEFVHSAVDLFTGARELRGEPSVVHRFVDFDSPEVRSMAARIETSLVKDHYRGMVVNTSSVKHLFQGKMQRDLGGVRRRDELR